MSSEKNPVTHDVHGEGDESVVLDQDREEVHPVDDHTELLYQRLSVEEVVGGNQKVPGQRSEPGKVVHLIHRITNIDNFSKTLQQK